MYSTRGVSVPLLRAACYLEAWNSLSRFEMMSDISLFYSLYTTYDGFLCGFYFSNPIRRY